MCDFSTYVSVEAGRIDCTTLSYFLIYSHDDDVEDTLEENEDFFPRLGTRTDVDRGWVRESLSFVALEM